MSLRRTLSPYPDNGCTWCWSVNSVSPFVCPSTESPFRSKFYYCILHTQPLPTSLHLKGLLLHLHPHLPGPKFRAGTDTVGDRVGWTVRRGVSGVTPRTKKELVDPADSSRLSTTKGTDGRIPSYHCRRTDNGKGWGSVSGEI